MTKEVKKAFMNRTRLKNRYLKDNTPKNKDNYKKSRNYCVGLVRKAKKKYFKALSVKDVIDNKKFWKTLKPLFTEKK